MKKFFILFFLLIAFSFSSSSQEYLEYSDYYQEFLADSLRFKSKHRVTSFDEFIQIQQPSVLSRNLEETPPPPGSVRAIAEYEPNQGVIIRGHTAGGQGRFHIPFSVIKDLSEHVIVYILCTNAQQPIINNTLNNNDVNMSNVEYINTSTNSQWTRDYSPWFVEYGENNSIGAINFEYDRPRPADNNVPFVVGPYFDINIYSMPMRHTGGNYMVDGFYAAASTDNIYFDNADELGLTPQQVDDMFEDYLGVTDYYVVNDALGLYIMHIDCWAKFLAPDKILILEVPETHSQYQEFEDAAEFWANQETPYGNNYQVFRVFTQPGTDEAYANSLIMNDRVYVPIKGGASSQRDADALAVYEEAMPGYTIIGVLNDTGSTGWYDTDALHCRTYQVPDFTSVRITHLPFIDDVIYQESFTFEADVVALGGGSIIENGVSLFYEVNGGGYQEVNMTNTTDNIYTVEIDDFQAYDEISYFIRAENNIEKVSFHPFIGEPDPHTFTIICGEINLGEDFEQCGGTVLLDAGDGFTSYEWNGILGGQTYVVTQSGNYQVTASTDFGCNVTDEINISLIPGSPNTTNDSSCGEAELTLSVDGNGTLNWYDDPVNGNLVNTGTQLTDHFNETTSFFVESFMEHYMSYYVGNSSSSSFGNYHTNNGFYIEFTALQSFNLSSVEVNADGAGERIIELRNTDDIVLQSTTVDVPDGVSRISIDFDIEPGDYRLACETEDPSLWRSNSGVNYPYTLNDVVSITGSNAGENFYYYFYHWEVLVLEECISERVEVTAYIFPELEVDFDITHETTTGAENGSVTVNISTGEPPYEFEWSNGSLEQTNSNLSGGNYGVTITDSNGCQIMESVLVITLDDDSPYANFEANITQGCDELTVQFTDLSLNDPTTWAWDFGDGNTSELQHPEHTYNTPGVYTVSLSVTNSEGADQFEIAEYIVISESPNLIISNDGPYCENETISLTTTGSTGGDTYEWSGPENFESALANPEIENSTISNSGEYSLIFTDSESGCYAQGSTIVTVNENPTLTVDNSGPYCEGETIELFSTATGGDSYLWTGPEDFSSTDENPTIENVQFNNGGIYTLTLTNQTTDCYTTESTEVVVYEFTQGGTVLGGTSIEPGQTSEQLILSDYTGTVLGWQSSNDLVEWTDIDHSEDNYVSVPLFETTHFRAEVQNGVCNSAYSEYTTVTMDYSSIYIVDTINVDGLDYVFHQFISQSFDFIPESDLVEMDVLIVAGGGGGAGSTGNAGRGGGGAGGVIFLESLLVTEDSYNIVVGEGGAGGVSGGASGNQGENSVFNSYIALGGGGGGNLSTNGGDGGSGGGAGVNNDDLPGGSELQPESASGGYGNQGGMSGSWDVGSGGGGGGGAGTEGANGTDDSGGDGGEGIEIQHFSPVAGYPSGWFAGGGGASSGTDIGEGGIGGGGDGSNNDIQAESGVQNTGGGGGGSQSGAGGNGGSGIVIVRHLLKPTANFTANETEICAGNSIVLTDLSLNNPEEWSWSFPGGNPETSNDPNPTITYNNPGIYSVSLEVVNSGGSSIEIKSSYIIVNENPTVDLGDDIEQCGGNIILDAGEGYVSYSWNGNPGTQTFEVTESGTYTVEVQNESECTSIDEITIDIYPEISITTESTPETSAGASDGTATVNIIGGTPDFIIQWSTEADTQTITGLEGGTYYVTVTDENECYDTDAVIVQTEASPPIANFHADQTTGCDELTVVFTDDSSNDPDTWLWNFGDGNTSDQQNPTHTYTNPGVYTVSLTVTNAFGADTFEQTDYISIGETPDISLSMTEESQPDAEDGTATVIVTFAGTYSVEWDNGETTETISNLEAGIYCVTVTNTDFGCEITDCIEVTQGTVDPGDEPIAEFTADITNGCAPQTIQFTDMSQNNPTSWIWDFGDGYGSISQNPTYTYSQHGIYTVSLTVSNEDGSDIAVYEDYITVGIKPVYSVEVTPASGENVSDGNASIIVDEVLEPYTILWSTNETTQQIDDLLPGAYSVVVTGAYGCTTVTAFGVSWTTNIEGVSNTFSIYPNPTRDILNIYTGELVADRIEMINVLGSVSKTLVPKSNKMSLDVTDLAPGVYFVKIITQTDNYLQRVVVK